MQAYNTARQLHVLLVTVHSEELFELDGCMMLMQAMALPMQGSLLLLNQQKLLRQMPSGVLAGQQPRISEALCHSLPRSDVSLYVQVV